jgi:protein phosphatase PTC7
MMRGRLRPPRPIVRAAAPLLVRRLHITFGAAMEPHPAKAKSGGEDGFFACDASGSFGVADGVGGSKRAGSDPGLFSRQLLRYCSEHLKSQGASASTRDENLRDAVAGASSSFAAAPIGGSSTFIIGQLERESGSLRLLNLGDSGAILFRPARRKFDSGTFLWPRIVMRSHEVSPRAPASRYFPDAPASRYLRARCRIRPETALTCDVCAAIDAIA